ncbi:MAG: hypothetical protein CMF24_03450 [Ilumatobacter sp.]|nr:hypothetical protein [Ilumatobacter sp.]
MNDPMVLRRSVEQIHDRHWPLRRYGLLLWCLTAPSVSATVKVSLDGSFRRSRAVLRCGVLVASPTGVGSL